MKLTAQEGEFERTVKKFFHSFSQYIIPILFSLSKFLCLAMELKFISQYILIVLWAQTVFYVQLHQSYSKLLLFGGE